MSQTVISGAQIKNATVQRQDLDVSTVGQAVVTKLVQGSGITLSSTGADSGTGDVTVSSPDVVSTDAGNIATLGTDNHILVPQSQIWSVRLRSFNAIGNPNFEVDQRTCGIGVGYGVGASPFCMDRWQANKAGMTGAATAVQTLGATNVPGTSFAIGGWFLRTTLTVAQASLAAGDLLWLNENIEGPGMRELINDVHSVSILCRSSVANLKFGLALRDGVATHSLVKLCSLGAANTWTLITLPNIPIWVSGGGWTFASGSAGYQLSITLASGTTYVTAANDVWQNANVIGAVGQSNFAANPVNSTFDIAYIGHEPGLVCSTPLDCPFTQNYDDCLRYFQKSYDYATPLNSAGPTYNGCAIFYIPPSSNPNVPIRFHKPMAKVPTMTGYSPLGGVNNVYDMTGATNRGITGINSVGQTGFTGFQISSVNAAGAFYSFHWTADGGW